MRSVPMEMYKTTIEVKGHGIWKMMKAINGSI
jgi:hypothetical protein